MKCNLECLLKRWYNNIRNPDLYKNAILGTLVYSIVAMFVVGILIVPTILMIPANYAVGEIALLIALIATGLVIIYASQIPTGVILRTLENKKASFSEILSYVIKTKIKQMGNAMLAYALVMLGFLIAVSLLAILGLIVNSFVLFGIGVLILLVGLLGLIVLAYFLWPVPVVAYKENVGFPALKKSIHIMKNSGWTGVGMFCVMLIIGWVISTVFNMLTNVFIQVGALSVLANPISAPIIGIFGMFIWGLVAIVVSGVIQVLTVVGQVEVYSEYSPKGKTTRTTVKRNILRKSSKEKGRKR